MPKKYRYLLLFFAICVSIFLHFYKIQEIPPCINADEAAFGYNAYSILKTGKDEYGRIMPLRFESFKDYKLPLYTYLSVPFVAIFGLNDFSTRALNILVGIAFVPLIYLLTKEFFKKDKIALIAAFLTSLNPGVYILSRHAHEGVIGTFFILLSLLFLIKHIHSGKFFYFLTANFFLVLNSFSYQTGRVYLLFFFVLQIAILFLNKRHSSIKPARKILLLLLFLGFSLFFDFKYGLNRVNNLFFFRNEGFQLRLTEYLGEDPNRLLHNKITEAVREVSNRYVSQFSPEYLVINGDSNLRFGFPSLSLFTQIELVFFLVGLYYLFKNKEKYTYLLIYIILITPLNNALTWQGSSLIRTYTLLFPFSIVIAYGFYNSSKYLLQRKLSYIVAALLMFIFIFFKILSFDTYFNHYSKRATVIRAWQCGYKELVNYVKENYDKYDKFYITDRHGQPYIFFLYYLLVDPKSYQKQAKISAPDRYGFGQIGKFDKFDFRFVLDPKEKRTVSIGYPEGFNNVNESILNKIKKITVGGEEIFWIYENN